MIARAPRATKLLERIAQGLEESGATARSLPERLQPVRQKGRDLAAARRGGSAETPLAP